MLEVKAGFKNRIFTSALLPTELILVPQVVTTKSLWETAEGLSLNSDPLSRSAVLFTLFLYLTSNRQNLWFGC